MLLGNQDLYHSHARLHKPPFCPFALGSECMTEGTENVYTVRAAVLTLSVKSSTPCAKVAMPPMAEPMRIPHRWGSTT